MHSHVLAPSRVPRYLQGRVEVLGIDQVFFSSPVKLVINKQIGSEYCDLHATIPYESIIMTTKGSVFGVALTNYLGT